jgi:hypothetical protein
MTEYWLMIPPSYLRNPASRRCTVLMSSPHSCRLAIVALEQPSEPLPAADEPLTPLAMVDRRHQDDVAFALVWAFGVIMAVIVLERLDFIHLVIEQCQ